MDTHIVLVNETKSQIFNTGLLQYYNDSKYLDDMKINLSKFKGWSFDNDKIYQIKDDYEIYTSLCDEYVELGG